MEETGPKPMVLLLGRTSGGDNVPVLVDATGLLAGGGNPFDQDLNTSDNVEFQDVVAASVTTPLVDGDVVTADTVFLATPILGAALPGSPTKGHIACITDSDTVTWGANVTPGGGAFTALIFYNGSHWTVIGK